MEKYIIEVSKRAKYELSAIYKAGDKAIIKKIETLLVELSEHPYTGTGKPEQLKGEKNVWSRRINKKDRLVYEVQEEKILVTIASAKGHYSDK